MRLSVLLVHEVSVEESPHFWRFSGFESTCGCPCFSRHEVNVEESPHFWRFSGFESTCGCPCFSSTKSVWRKVHISGDLVDSNPHAVVRASRSTKSMWKKVHISGDLVDSNPHAVVRASRPRSQCGGKSTFLAI